MSETPFYLPSARRPHPGRPRKHPENGHTPGTQAVQVVEQKGQEGRTLAWQACAPALPRLLNIDATAQYLDVSTWTIWTFLDNETRKPVRIPRENGKNVRKLVFDRLDLDALVTKWKEQA